MPPPPARVRRLQAPTPRVALLIGAALVVAVILYLGRDALTPFVIGLVLIYVLDPPVEWLARRRVPRALAVLIVYAVALLLIVQGTALLMRPLVSQIGAFVQESPRFLAALEEQLRSVREVYDRLGLPTPLRGAVDRALADAGQGAARFDPSSLVPIARTIAGTLASLFGFLIVPVWAFYILKDRETLIARFDGSLPAGWRDDIWAVLHIVERVFGRWLRGQLFLGLVVGAATFVGLLVLGRLVDPRFFQFAVLLAVVAGLFELLPIIGPILSAIPSVLLALTISPAAVVAVIALYVIVQQVENNVLVPKIQGDAIELHPAVVIFALVIGGAIAGLLGAIFALPITAAARDVYRYLFRRLSDGPVEPAEQSERTEAGRAGSGATEAGESRREPIPVDGSSASTTRVGPDAPHEGDDGSVAGSGRPPAPSGAVGPGDAGRPTGGS
ncbi:MAG: AI-2E family transporter [Chloroflexota bacterium]|nr:AI-2E family transporter [Chloroflexota bacterium]